MERKREGSWPERCRALLVAKVMEVPLLSAFKLEMGCGEGGDGMWRGRGVDVNGSRNRMGVVS